MSICLVSYSCPIIIHAIISNWGTYVTNSRRPAFCWKWAQRSVLLLLLLLHLKYILFRYCHAMDCEY